MELLNQVRALPAPTVFALWWRIAKRVFCCHISCIYKEVIYSMKMSGKKKISINNILLICWLAVSLYIVGVIIAFSLNVIYTDRKEDLAYNQILADGFAENANRDLIAMINTINMIYAEDVQFC